jgi:hypothetical protein
MYWIKLLILNFSNLVVRIKILLNLRLETLLIFIVASYGGPQIKVSFQISNFQTIIC